MKKKMIPLRDEGDPDVIHALRKLGFHITQYVLADGGQYVCLTVTAKSGGRCLDFPGYQE